MADAPCGDDVYGEDPTVKDLESRAAALLGKKEAVFLPSGTMANAVAIGVHTSGVRGAEIVCSDTSHVYNYETAGASQLWGAAFRPLATDHRGRISLADVSKALERRRGGVGGRTDVHEASSALVCVELTHNRSGGALLGENATDSLTYLSNLKDLCTDHGVCLHMDGARLFNAAVALECSASELSKYVDTLTLCLSKGLGCPVGSILAGSSEFISNARRLRKMLGGGMRQAGILAAAGMFALRDESEPAARLAEDHRRARQIADGLQGLAMLKVTPSEVRTNVVYIGVDPHVDTLAWSEFLHSNYGILISSGLYGSTPSDDLGGKQEFPSLRIMTHSDMDDESINSFLEGTRIFFSPPATSTSTTTTTSTSTRTSTSTTNKIRIQ